MKRILAAAAAVALSLAGFGTAAAWADEAPPTDPVVTEQVVPDPVVDEVATEPEAEPEAPAQDAPAEPAAANKPSPPPSNDKLPICHSGSGAHWSYIAPDASGYNGHKNHDLDIYGLTEAECLAKNVDDDPAPDPEPVDVDYVTVGWLAPGAPPHHFDSPQSYLFSNATEDPALNTLDDEIAAYLATLECGTSADIQVDVYLDDATTAALIAGGHLDGPNNPTEHLIPGGEGTAWKFVHIEADACVVHEPIFSETVIPGGATCVEGGGSGTYVVTTTYYRSDWDEQADAYGTPYLDPEKPATQVVVEVGSDRCPHLIVPPTGSFADECGPGYNLDVPADNETGSYVVDASGLVNGEGTLFVSFIANDGYFVLPSDTYELGIVGEPGLPRSWAVWEYQATNEACPTPPPALALTGSPYAGPVLVVGILLVVGGIGTLLVFVVGPRIGNRRKVTTEE